MPNFNETLKDYVDNIENPNIVLIGGAGVGKSSLINAVFGKLLAEAGVALGGLTPTFTRYHVDHGVPITLYDSAGHSPEVPLEAWKKETLQFLEQQLKKGKHEQIHAVWFVISAPSARVFRAELDVLERLNKEHIPVVIVLSQWDIAKDEERRAMMAILEEHKLGKIYAIIPVAADPIPGKPKTGLDELVNKTAELLPKIYADGFVAAQLVSIKAKRAVAYAYVSGLAAACFAVGYVPVPFSTAVATYFGQRGLAKKLAALYSYEKLKNLPDLVKDATKTKEARFMFIATSLFDLFPFEIFTSTIAGAMAAAYVMIVGLALAATFEELAKLQIEGMPVEEIERQMRTIFKEKFDKWRGIIRNVKGPSDLESYKDIFLGGSEPSAL